MAHYIKETSRSQKFHVGYSSSHTHTTASPHGDLDLGTTWGLGLLMAITSSTRQNPQEENRTFTKFSTTTQLQFTGSLIMHKVDNKPERQNSEDKTSPKWFCPCKKDSPLQGLFTSLRANICVDLEMGQEAIEQMLPHPNSVIMSN